MLNSLWTDPTTAVLRAPPPSSASRAISPNVVPLRPSRENALRQPTSSEKKYASEEETSSTFRRNTGLMDEIEDMIRGPTVGEPTALTVKARRSNILSRTFEEDMVRQLSQATPPSLPTPPSTSLRSPAVQPPTIYQPLNANRPQQPPGGAPPGRTSARFITIPLGRACAFCPRPLSNETGVNAMWMFPQCDDVSQHDLCSLYTNTT